MSVHLNNTIDCQRVYSFLRNSSFKGPIVCEIQAEDIEQTIDHCLESSGKDL